MLVLLTLALVVGALTAGGLARLHFVRAHPTFRCKLRWPEDSSYLPAPWPRRRVRAAWVHDVLLVHRGIVRPRTVVLAADNCDRSVRRTYCVEVSGLGTEPVVLSVCLDDGRRLEVAARRRDVGALAGPFVAAAMRSLPDAPNEPQPRDG